MDTQQLVFLLKEYSPAHFRDICSSLSTLADELEYTKVALAKNLIDAQNHNNFSKAREILDAQKELSHYISNIQGLISNKDASNDFEENDLEEENDKSDYSEDDILEQWCLSPLTSVYTTKISVMNHIKNLYAL